MGQVIAEAPMAVGLLLLVITMVILGTLFRDVLDWIVGMFFTDTIIGTLNRIGVDTMGLTMWQLGATLGFVGGFFKSIKVQKK